MIPSIVENSRKKIVGLETSCSSRSSFTSLISFRGRRRAPFQRLQGRNWDPPLFLEGRYSAGVDTLKEYLLVRGQGQH